MKIKTTRGAIGAALVLAGALFAARSFRLSGPGLVDVPAPPGSVRIPAGNVRGLGGSVGTPAPGPVGRGRDRVQPRHALPDIPPESPVVLVPRVPGARVEDLVEIRYQTWGLCFKPGLVLTLAPLGAGADVKLAYFRKAGLAAGVVHARRPLISTSPHVGLSYRIWGNTEIAAGYAPLSPLPIWTGIRLNF